MYLNKNEAVHDYMLKQRRLVIPFAVTGNATPASKTHTVDAPQLVFLSFEGQTAIAAAEDSGQNLTAPNDANGIIGVLVKVGETVRKVLQVKVEQRDGTTSTVATAVTALKGASSSGVTASGNIAASITITGLDLSAENYNGVLIVEYVIE